MSNPGILDSSTWKFLYPQITSGQIGQQCLFDVNNGVPNTSLYTRGNGLFNGGDTAVAENFYNLTVNVEIGKFTNESLVVANYYAQKQNLSYSLLGIMGNQPTESTLGNGNITFSNFSEQDTKFHTLLFNTNIPNPSDTTTIITISYYEGLNIKSILTQIITVVAANNNKNFIYTLTKSVGGPGDLTYWNTISIAVARGSNLTTNIVGILKTTEQLTPENLVCFAENSMVFTRDGEVPIQNLKKGDLVYDENYNLQTVEFVAKRTVFPSSSVNKYSIPYKIKQGQLGENIPSRDTIVSSAHLIKHDGKMVPASELGTPVDVSSPITYYNVSVSNYSTMIVNGIVSETLDTSNDTKVYEKTF